jgi:hypothetical protein
VFVLTKFGKPGMITGGGGGGKAQLFLISMHEMRAKNNPCTVHLSAITTSFNLMIINIAHNNTVIVRSLKYIIKVTHHTCLAISQILLL